MVSFNIFSTRHSINLNTIQSISVARYDGFIGEIMAAFGKAIKVECDQKTFYLNKMSIVKQLKPLLPGAETVDALKNRIFPKSASFKEGELKRLLSGLLPRVERQANNVETKEQKLKNELRDKRERIKECQQGNLLENKRKLNELNASIIAILKANGKETYKLSELFKNEGDGLASEEELKKFLSEDQLSESVEARKELRSIMEVMDFCNKPNPAALDKAIQQKENQIQDLKAQLKAKEDKILEEKNNIEIDVMQWEKYSQCLQLQESEINKKLKDWKNILEFHLVGDLNEVKKKEVMAKNELSMARKRFIQAEQDRSFQVANLTSGPEGIALSRLERELSVLRPLYAIDEKLYVSELILLR